MDLDGLHTEDNAETEQGGQQSHQIPPQQALFPILPPSIAPRTATPGHRLLSVEELKVPADQQDS